LTTIGTSALSRILPPGSTSRSKSIGTAVNAIGQWRIAKH
jgi:hypothetical protein